MNMLKWPNGAFGLVGRSLVGFGFTALMWLCLGVLFLGCASSNDSQPQRGHDAASTSSSPHKGSGAFLYEDDDDDAPATASESLSHVTPSDLRKLAIAELIKASNSDNPMLRANAIEASEYLVDRTMQLAQLGLDDSNEAVRFVAATMIGKLNISALLPALKKLTDDPSPSVRAAVLFARQRCGENVDISPLAGMLAKPDSTLRSNVVLLLGLLGEPSAIAMLRDVAKLPASPQITAVERDLTAIQMAEAMALLGDVQQYEAVRAGVYSPFDEVSILAVQALGRLNDRQYIPALLPLLKQNPIEKRIAAAHALAKMGELKGQSVVLQLSQSPLATVRSQAALALGMFPGQQALRARKRLLGDQMAPVRLAAATSILAARRR